ncbi:MAG: phytoene desaturase [Candidatus Iainarchaeum archaeon]|uniref:Phytoene desaturase n=1 Tax=Candidatus Iainarchaeum sp. TaxID=3101447 RepID=A0A7T9DKG6_9ARCH|nr:MAG: phytoene desaturase [Candidatus Diapherotrites archaeon]
MSQEKILIIGGGLGGLALACRLAKQGNAVEVFERHASVGGRVAQKKVKGYTIDLGPTFMLMPGEFEELFTYCGRDMRDYVPIQRLDPCYRLHFADQTHMDFYSGLPEMLHELKRFAQQDLQGYLNFLAYQQEKYAVVYENFITQPADSLSKIALSPQIFELLNLDGFISMWDHAAKFFSDEHLRLGFSFQSMYLGESPLATPGTYSIIPFVELTQGVWYPTQGIRSIVDGIAKLAKELGVKVHVKAAVQEIIIDEQRRATGIRLENGAIVTADRIVSNLDLPATYVKLIPASKRAIYTDKKVNALKYSSSAFMLFLGVDKDYAQLEHHNVFFCKDYLHNFKQLFDTMEVPQDPSVYVNVPTRTNPKLAPKGKHLLYVLVPVPIRPQRDGKAWDWNLEKEGFADAIITQLEARGLNDLRKHIRMKEVFTPHDWEALGGMHLGSTFGLSPIFFQSSVFRPKQKSEEFKSLYFVGASTHPGSGMPMVLISARTCQQLIQRDSLERNA